MAKVLHFQFAILYDLNDWLQIELPYPDGGAIECLWSVDGA